MLVAVFLSPSLYCSPQNSLHPHVLAPLVKVNFSKSLKSLFFIEVFGAPLGVYPNLFAAYLPYLLHCKGKHICADTLASVLFDYGNPADEEAAVLRIVPASRDRNIPVVRDYICREFIRGVKFFLKALLSNKYSQPYLSCLLRQSIVYLKFHIYILITKYRFVKRARLYP